MTPPGWEQSKGIWLSGAIKGAYPFFMPKISGSFLSQIVNTQQF
ncbi:hypothetical protein BN1088_1430183 [Sphingobacterium sp. PM2-P1-29]|nr:hypothetical protein BN1088_1430183 [Sphingobacterium sp. PM2-P1-29]